jgi:hypothetical protein
MWAATTDSPEQLGDAYRDLAEVHRLSGSTDDARKAFEQALAAYERKGLLPMAERTRRDLETLQAQEAASG